MQYASGKMHLTTRNVQQTTSRRHAACSGQYAANNRRHATRDRRHAPDFKQHAADNHDMQRNIQHAACNAQRAACTLPTQNLEFGKDHCQQAARQQTAHAAHTAQKTAQPGSVCNRQRASDSRLHARGREHMRDATGKTRHRRISGAASSGQGTASSIPEALCPTTSAQHGSDAIHKMQHTTGAAACSKHTRSRQHAAGNAMHGTRDEAKGSRTLAHL